MGKKIGGIIMILIGLLGLCAFLFFGFDGKYGMNQMMTSLSRFRMEASALPIGLGALGVLIWGVILLFKKPKP